MARAFRRYLESIDMKEKKYNLRTFRKNFATTAVESGEDLYSGSVLFVHSNITTTEKYYTRAKKQKLAADLKKLNFKGE